MRQEFDPKEGVAVQFPLLGENGGEESGPAFVAGLVHVELVLEPDVRKGLVVFAQHDLGDVDEIQVLVLVAVVCDETVADLVDVPLLKALG